MATTFDGRLYRLYVEFAEFQDRRNRPHEAADAYALALYYARRIGDPQLVERCERRIVERSPSHIAAQAMDAPLFFAQLMMRYPADEVEQALDFAYSPTLSSYQTRVATAPVNVDAKGPLPIGLEIASELVHHHPLPTALMVAPTTPTRSDDFLLGSQGLLAEEEDDPPKRRGSEQWIEWTARIAVVLGAGAVYYMSRELYPLLANIEPASVWSSSPEGASDVQVVFSEEGEQPADFPSRPILSAGANSAVELEEPASKESPLKISSRRGDPPSK